MTAKRQLFIWRTHHISMLLREVVVEEPYKHAVGSPARGAVWSAIAEHLCQQGLKVTQRTVREKFDKLFKEFKEREKEERLASGVEVEYDENYQAMTEINDRIAEWVGIRQEKEKNEKAIAEEMRKRATEKLSETSRRRNVGKNSDDSEEVEDVSPNKRKRSQTNLVDVMHESVHMKKAEQEEQRELRKRELDMRAAEIQQQQQFQAMLLQQQQQAHQQQQAMNMAMLNTINELLKNMKK